MRNPADYSTHEWLRAKPLVDGVKLARNSIVERLYRARRTPELGSFLADHTNLRGRTVAVSVAFNTPWVIELLARTASRNLINASLIVVDNSTRQDARAEIRQICAHHDVPYLALPRSPVRHVSRSHGVALTWTYYNVIRPLRPSCFAYLDHDLFPLRQVDLAALVRKQPVYGRETRSRYGWSIWAGFCVFEFSAVAGHPLDFNTDRPRELDTGGRNWIRLYRYLDPKDITLTASRWVSMVDPETASEIKVEVIDGFVHVGQVSHALLTGWTDEARRTFFCGLVERNEGYETFDDLVQELEASPPTTARTGARYRL